MTLTLIIGARGSGKTLYMLLMSLKSKRLVYSNFDIKIKRRRELSIISLFSLPNNIEVMLDEAYTWLESRTSGRALNRYMSYIAFQLRKSNRNVFCSVQQIRTIDPRYRSEWDFLVFPKRVSNGSSDRGKWDFQFKVIDGNNLKVSTWRIPYSKAEKYFPYYNTYEIVDVVDKDYLIHDLLKHAPKMYWKRVQKIGNDIVDSLNAITHPAVRDALVKNGYGEWWESSVYMYLKKIVV